MLNTKNNLFILTILVFSFLNTNRTEATDKIDSINRSFGYEPPQTNSTQISTSEPISSSDRETFTVIYDGKETTYQRYFNDDTQSFSVIKTTNEYEPSISYTNIDQDLSLFNQQPTTLNESQIISYEEPKSSHEHPTTSSCKENTASQEYDHFDDFTRDQRQASIQEAEEQKFEEQRNKNSLDINTSKNISFIKEEDYRKNQNFYFRDRRIFDSEIILKSVRSENELKDALLCSIIKARWERLNTHFESKPIKHDRSGKEYSYKNELKFIEALKSGKVVELIDLMQNTDLAVAESAFNELKDLWGWKRDHTFLIPNVISGTGESAFITALGIDMLAILERYLITRPDYIAKYASKDDIIIIEEFKELCTSLQKKNDTGKLFNNVKTPLFHQVIQNGNQTQLVDNICLAIAEKAVLDPINTVLGRIKHAHSAEAALQELCNLEMQLLKYAENNKITLWSDVRAKVIQKYGFDILEMAHQMYKSNRHYVDIPQNQSILSNSLIPILHNIQHLPLPLAHTELMYVQNQITENLESHNIIDPVKQKEHIIKNFGSDIRETIKNAYLERPDFLNLTKLFTPINVASTNIKIISTNKDYLSVSSALEKVAEQVLGNAQLCHLECLPQAEDHLIQSLQIMKNPHSPAEFIFNATVVDHILTDLQCQANAIVIAKPTIWQRSPQLFTTALVSFFTNLNPIEQAKDIGSLFVETGYLLGNAVVKTAEEIYDPIGRTKQKIVSALQACEYLVNTACFATDAIFGTSYLPAEVYQQRCDSYLKVFKQITADDIAKLAGKLGANFVYGKAHLSTCAYLKQIDALGKISNKTKIALSPLKEAVKKHPQFVTAEGIVLKMSNGMKNAGNAIKESALVQKAILKVANMKEFFQLPFGKTLYPHSSKTKGIYQKQSIYKLTQDIPGTTLKEGYFYYLDNLHKDHIEVFNKKRNFVGVYNLDGSFNTKKFQAAQKEGRNIKELIKG